MTTRSYFGCGEFSPGTRRIGGGRRNRPPPKIIPLPKVGIEPPPGIPKFPTDEWVCVCDETSAWGEFGCNPATRRCDIKANVSFPGRRMTRSYTTKAECERFGFGEEPCSVATFRCEKQVLTCPDQFYTYIQADCFFCGRKANPTAQCPHRSIADCQQSPDCQSTDCPDIPRPTTPRDPLPGGPTRNPNSGLDPYPGVRRDGPVTQEPTPRLYWGCVNVSSFCASDRRVTERVVSQCQSRLLTRRDETYRYLSDSECRRYCASSPRTFQCPPTTNTTNAAGVLANTITTSEPIDRVGAGNPVPGAGINFDQFTNSLIGAPRAQSRMFLDTDVISVDESFNSNFIDSSTSSQGGLYHTVYNVFDFSTDLTNTYENNYLNLGIFADYVSSEVAYLLRNKNSNIEWNEKYITGLTQDKLIKSLDGKLYQAFKSILDIDGQAIPIGYFLNMVRDHLFRGTIDQLNPGYFISLAERHKQFSKLTLKLSQNQELNRRAALGLMSKDAQNLSPSSYSDPQLRLEANRQKFLLSDIEASMRVETIAEETFTVGLEDAGLIVSSLSGVGDHVPAGVGGGYYLTLETVDGEVLPLLLDTAEDKAFLVSPETRKLALNVLGEDPAMYLSVSSLFETSELGSGFNTNYTASAIYYKLDLATTRSVERTDNLVESVQAQYVKVSDPADIQLHSKTYGAKATELSLMYDDPFIQYADRSGRFVVHQKDVTFRQFEPKRSSGDSSILIRTLPDIIIVNPVSAVADNPFQAYSTFESFTDSYITRSMRVAPHFGLTDEVYRSPLLSTTLLAQAEGKFSYGLLEESDSQNFYYLFNESNFPNKFTVTRRPPVGYVFYNIMEERLKGKYTYDYLTWWDIFRRLNMNEFSSFIYSVPRRFLSVLETGYKGHLVKSVLDRVGVKGSVLQLKDGETEDAIVLTEKMRNAPGS